MRRDKTDEPAAWANGVGAGMGGIVESGLRITDDVHGRDIGPNISIFVLRDRKRRPIDLCVGLDDLFYRTGFDQPKAARRLPQSKSKRLQVVRGRNSERARLRRSALH